MQKVERRALGAEQRAGVALDLQHHLVGSAAGAFGHMPGQLHGRVERTQGGLGPGGATDHGGLARQDARAGAALGVDQASGEVAAAHVFFKGTGHVQQHLGVQGLAGFVFWIGHGREA